MTCDFVESLDEGDAEGGFGFWPAFHASRELLDPFRQLN